NLHARRHVVADHLNHITLRLETRGRPVSDANLDELTDACTAVTPRSNQHLLLDLRIIRLDETNAGFLEITPDDAFVGALDHLDNGALATPPPIQAGDPRQGTITIEHQAHLRRPEEQVITAVIRHQEAEAVTMTANPTTDQIKLIHRGIGATPGIDQLTIALHRAQPTTQGLGLFVIVQAELFQELLPGRGRTALIQAFENQLTAGNRVFILFRLAGGLGIEGLPIGH